MLNATEARIQSNSIAEGKKAEQISKVEKAINNAIARGLFECTIDGGLLTVAHLHLKSLGYVVNERSARNGTLTTISW